jgi:hypothetical protein
VVLEKRRVDIARYEVFHRAKGREEYLTYNIKKEGLLDWSQIALELPSETGN